MTATTRRTWTALTDAQLLAQCAVDTYRASGPGGQKRNKTSSAVRLRHLPSGLAVIAEESRSQHENRARALRRPPQAPYPQPPGELPPRAPAPPAPPAPPPPPPPPPRAGRPPPRPPRPPPPPPPPPRPPPPRPVPAHLDPPPRPPPPRRPPTSPRTRHFVIVTVVPLSALESISKSSMSRLA